MMSGSDPMDSTSVNRPSEKRIKSLSQINSKNILIGIPMV